MNAAHGKVVYQFLLDRGIAKKSGETTPSNPWIITWGNEPKDGLKTNTVTDTGADQDGRAMDDGERTEYPTAMLTFRSNDYAAAVAKMQAVERLFDTKSGFYRASVTVDGEACILHAVHVRTKWTKIGKTEQDLDLFTMNVQITAESA